MNLEGFSWCTHFFDRDLSEHTGSCADGAAAMDEAIQGRGRAAEASGALEGLRCAGAAAAVSGRLERAGTDASGAFDDEIAPLPPPPPTAIQAPLWPPPTRIQCAAWHSLPQ